MVERKKPKFTCRIKEDWIPGWVREFVMSRDEKKCVMCGDRERLEIHHISPRLEGGVSVPNNLLVLCQYCHDIAEEEHLRTRALIEGWWNRRQPKEEVPEKSDATDWRQWVYGGQRNPMKDLTWP